MCIFLSCHIIIASEGILISLGPGPSLPVLFFSGSFSFLLENEFSSGCFPCEPTGLKYEVIDKADNCLKILHINLSIWSQCCQCGNTPARFDNYSLYSNCTCYLRCCLHRPHQATSSPPLDEQQQRVMHQHWCPAHHISESESETVPHPTAAR